MQNNDKSIPSPSQAPGELVEFGEKIYFKKRDELEKTSLGQFAVIEVESEEIFINPDKLVAIQQAQAKYPNKLFYIVQIGNLREPSSQEVNEANNYGWSF